MSTDIATNIATYSAAHEESSVRFNFETNHTTLQPAYCPPFNTTLTSANYGSITTTHQCSVYPTNCCSFNAAINPANY